MVFRIKVRSYSVVVAVISKSALACHWSRVMLVPAFGKEKNKFRLRKSCAMMYAASSLLGLHLFMQSCSCCSKRTISKASPNFSLIKCSFCLFRTCSIFILEIDFELKTGSFGSPVGYALGLVVIVMAFLTQGF